MCKEVLVNASKERLRTTHLRVVDVQAEIQTQYILYKILKHLMPHTLGC
jgi:hypothetical protein